MSSATEEEQNPELSEVDEEETESETGDYEVSSDEDEFLASLTEEQRAKIQERQTALQAKYKKYNEKQQASKIQDLMNSDLCPADLTEEEAQVAVECCNNDELEAAQRLATEFDFVEKVREMVAEKKWSRENGMPFTAGDGKEKVQITIDLNGKRTTRAMSKKQNKTNGTKPPSGFKMNGEARAKSLRLGDALAQLEAMKKEKESKEQTMSFHEDDRSQKSEIITEQEEPKDIFKKGTKVQVHGKGNELIRGTIAKVLPDRMYWVKLNNGKLKKTVVEKNISNVEKEESDDEKPSFNSRDNEKEEEIPKETSNQTCDDEYNYTREELLALGWSEARVKAFMNRKSNPNAYYYRFNAPGEEQATGEWDKASVDLFMELIKDGVNYRWGEFSMKIPGRVGYQCSNFYRKLILDGVISDPNYTFVDGKLKFTRPKGLKRGSSSTCTVEENPKIERLRRKRLAEGHANLNKKRKKPKRRKGRKGDTVYADDVDSADYDSDDVGAYGYGNYGAKRSSSTTTNPGSGKRVSPEPELIPGLRCPMTYEPIYDPAISPYGHVMSYDTWLRVLGRKPRNTCPFTKQPLTRRSLVKLTAENVEEYRSKIVDVTSNLICQEKAAS